MFWASKQLQQQQLVEENERKKRNKKRKKKTFKGNISCYLNVFYITF